jgi:hypothetical protein
MNCLTTLTAMWHHVPYGQDHILHSIGNSVLRHLHSNHGNWTIGNLNTIAYEAHALNHSIPPSLKLLLADVFAGPMAVHGIYDFVHGESDPSITYINFLTNVYIPFTSSPWNSSYCLYGAMGIVATDIGMESCLSRMTPYNISKDTIQDDCSWMSVWTPCSAITHPHMDFYGALQYFVHIFGIKLWLL